MAIYSISMSPFEACEVLQPELLQLQYFSPSPQKTI